MKRKLATLLVAIGSLIAETGGRVAQLGVQVEHAGLDALRKHPAFVSNAELDGRARC